MKIRAGMEVVFAPRAPPEGLGGNECWSRDRK